MNFRHHVKYFAVVLESHEAVRASSRNGQRLTVRFGELRREPAPISWRLWAQVERYIVNSAACAANKLCFQKWRCLNMQPAQRTLVSVPRRVALLPSVWQTRGLEGRRIEGPREQSAPILVNRRPYYGDSRQFRRTNLQ
jgi:hypothetical protein